MLANTKALAESLLSQGFKLVSGGSDNHLLLIDLSDTETTGKVFEEALGRVHITVNKNTVPSEKRSPFVTSGVRIGTPAVTSRGLKEEHMKVLARLLKDVLTHHEDAVKMEQMAAEVKDLAASCPLYPEWRNC